MTTETDRPSPRATAMLALCTWLRPKLRAPLTEAEIAEMAKLLLAYRAAGRQPAGEARTAPPASPAGKARRPRVTHAMSHMRRPDERKD